MFLFFSVFLFLGACSPEMFGSNPSGNFAGSHLSLWLLTLFSGLPPYLETLKGTRPQVHPLPLSNTWASGRTDPRPCLRNSMQKCSGPLGTTVPSKRGSFAFPEMSRPRMLGMACLETNKAMCVRWLLACLTIGLGSYVTLQMNMVSTKRGPIPSEMDLWCFKGSMSTHRASPPWVLFLGAKHVLSLSKHRPKSISFRFVSRGNPHDLRPDPIAGHGRSGAKARTADNRERQTCGAFPSLSFPPNNHKGAIFPMATGGLGKQKLLMNRYTILFTLLQTPFEYPPSKVKRVFFWGSPDLGRDSRTPSSERITILFGPRPS